MEHTASALNKLTEQIIGAAIHVHRTLGPGLLESAYEACLHQELVTRGMAVERQKPLPLSYGDVALDCVYRMDMVVEDAVVIEVKSVTKLDRVHEALEIRRVLRHRRHQTPRPAHSNPRRRSAACNAGSIADRKASFA
jgi:GxxExxY protein